MKKKFVFLAAMALSVQPPVQAASPSLSSAENSAANYIMKGMDYVLDGVDGLLPDWMPKGRDLWTKHIGPFIDHWDNTGLLPIVFAITLAGSMMALENGLEEAQISEFFRQDRPWVKTGLMLARNAGSFGTLYLLCSGIPYFGQGYNEMPPLQEATPLKASKKKIKDPKNPETPEKGSKKAKKPLQGDVFSLI